MHVLLGPVDGSVPEIRSAGGGGSSGRSVRSGTGLRSGSVRVGETNSISITGGLVGTAANPVIILAAEQVTAGPTGNVPLRKLSIGRSVEFAQILTGYQVNDLGPKDGDAGIGAITVGGDWIASNIAAGIDDGADNKFGTNDDAIIGSGNNANETSKIGSITIGGMIRGTVGGTDHCRHRGRKRRPCESRWHDFTDHGWHRQR